MKKFLLMLILLGVATWIVYTTWFKEKPKKETLTPTSTQVDELQNELPPTPGVELYKKGEYKDAVRNLSREINERPAEEIHQLLYYLALSYEKLEDNESALETWRRLARKYPTSIYCGEAYYKMAHAQSDYGKKILYLEKAVETHPQSPGGQLAAVELGRHYLEYNNPNLSEVEKQCFARKLFSIALRGNLPSNTQKELKQKLTSINKNLVFSPALTPDSIIYKVKPGDTLWTISNKYKVPPGSDRPGQEYLGQIRRINHLKTTNIRADNEFKIITGKFHIEIDKSGFTLTLYLDNNFVKEYPIAVGSSKNPTRTGTFHIVNKEVNPVWYREDENKGQVEAIPFGHPRHVIGTRWMGFKERERLGIHGTTDPSSIGKAITKGCIRMHKDDVEELFDLVGTGSEVIIKE